MSKTDDGINADMHRYYNERASEYELIYSGGHPASINEPSLFQHDAAAVAALLPGLIGPAHLELAAGTGYWLRFYHAACERVTLVDQSERMLDECRKKIAALDLGSKAEIVQADLLAYQFPQSQYDSVLMGFLWSHLTEDEEKLIFAGASRALKPGGRLLIIDSAWSPERAATREKSAVQTRTLVDGRTFAVRKRYLDEDELRAMGKRLGLEWRALFSGKAFIAAEGIPRPGR